MHSRLRVERTFEIGLIFWDNVFASAGCYSELLTYKFNACFPDHALLGEQRLEGRRQLSLNGAKSGRKLGRDF